MTTSKLKLIVVFHLVLAGVLVSAGVDRQDAFALLLAVANGGLGVLRLKEL